jgi:4-hydroxy-tetrahydrodipicolinate reductase
MTRIAINGSKGKMGQALIEAINSSSQSDFGAGFDKGDNLIDSISNFEVLIDFSRPEASLNALAVCKDAGKAMVIGTTGFTDSELELIGQASKEIPIVFAPNMSVGVNLTLKILETSAKVIGPDSSIEIIELITAIRLTLLLGLRLKWVR